MDLFVSHVSEDRDSAMQIVEELERRGVRCWIAPRDVQPGKPFDDEIADAIEASVAMLLIFSEQCNESEYIRREVTVAGESQKVIIPFRIENAQPKRGFGCAFPTCIGSMPSSHATERLMRSCGRSESCLRRKLPPLRRSHLSTRNLSDPTFRWSATRRTPSGRRISKHPAFRRKIEIKHIRMQLPECKLQSISPRLQAKSSVRQRKTDPVEMHSDPTVVTFSLRAGALRVCSEFPAR